MLQFKNANSNKDLPVSHDVPEYPVPEQSQVYEPAVLVHEAPLAHACVPREHSSSSGKVFARKHSLIEEICIIMQYKRHSDIKF